MAITFVQRPIGQVLSETEVTATVTGVGVGSDALFTKVAHGLVNGNYVYVTSDIGQYNGFAYVFKQSNDTFKLSTIAVYGDYIEFIQAVTVTYIKSIGECVWSCVELPIIYRLSNNRYPTNNLDPSRTISSYTNDGGYVNLNLSGALGGVVKDLDFITITGATSPGIDGVYQIMDAISTSDITINLAHDSIVFGSAVVKRYYNNYHVVIEVYAGLNATHFWTSQKPYELAGTLRIIPDENNEIIFSVNEILKGYVQTKNNLTLGTLPNNIDAFTQFYIVTYESYDVGTGYSFINFESTHTSDQANFEGVAINAKLPFKNVQSGFMSEYQVSDFSYQVPLAKFLTLFETPVLFSNSSYQDISVIITGDGQWEFKQVWVQNPNDPDLYVDNLTYQSGDYVLYRPDSKVYQCQTNNTINITPPTDASAWYFVRNAVIVETDSASSDVMDDGVHRFQLDYVSGYAFMNVYVWNDDFGNEDLPQSEVKRITLNSDCTQQTIQLMWLNYLGGFDSWMFTTQKDYLIDIGQTQETKTNIFPDWPKSYDPNADTVRKNTSRDSAKQIVIYSQNVEQDELDAIQFIKTSPLVQIIVSRTDRRTVIVDNKSFKVYSDGDKLHNIELTLTYTDDIPSQSV